VISGTDFRIEDPELIGVVGRTLPAKLVSASELRDLEAECRGNEALCVACDDGMAVVDLRINSGEIEMFVRMAVAFRHGAYERQGPALAKIACDLGASVMAFESRRRGWGRRLGPEWTRRGLDEFQRRV
jgi:hypothetical protein